MNLDQRVYKAAAKRLAREIGRLMAEALVSEAEHGENCQTAKELRDIANKLSAVLEGLKSKLGLAPSVVAVDKFAMTHTEMLEALHTGLWALDFKAQVVCTAALIAVGDNKLPQAIEVLEHHAWHPSAVQLANRVVKFLKAQVPNKEV